MGETSEKWFWGETDHSLDDKGRLLIPTNFREALGREVMLTRGPDRVLLMMTPETWAGIEVRLYSDAVSTHSRILQRMFGSRARIKVDSRWRLSIPQTLREWAEIDLSEQIVLLGQGETIEIWSRPRWQEYQQTFTSANTVEAAALLGLTEVFKLR